MTCACDTHRCSVHTVSAGLKTLTLGRGTFPDWRERLLEAIGDEAPLAHWRARDPGDFGVMLTEMAAYMCDVTSFYDGFVADESYLGTASLADSPRRLTSILGYRPRPALAASVWLAAEADGVRTVDLPVGMAFRSGAFPGSAPQVFEIAKAVEVEPRVNRFAVARVPAQFLPAPLGWLDVTEQSLRVRNGDLLVLDMGGTLAATRAASQVRLHLRTRDRVARLGIDPVVTPPSGATYAATRLLRPGRQCGLWKLTPVSGEVAVIGTTDLSLDAITPIGAGEIVLIECGTSLFARRVTAVGAAIYTILNGLTSTLTAADGTKSTMLSPAITSTTTRITLDQAVPLTAGDAARVLVHYAMSDAGTLNVPLKDTLDQGDPVRLPDFADAPRVAVASLALGDAAGEAVVTSGSLDPPTRRALLDGEPAWGRSLLQPVILRGNVFIATRGESVRGEVLGEGDASAQVLAFRLKKKPLTYVAAANETGRESTLSVHVGGIRWSEVDTFYGQPPDACCYVVRHDEAGETEVEFGGCARPPTGAAIVADYRFGAGAAAPPADSVKQIARAVAGLRSVANPLPAFGGADAESPADIAINGPPSALMLGRAVSLADFAAAARQQRGVRSANATWTWDDLGQAPMVVVRYIGDPQLASSLLAVLHALAEDDAPITVRASLPQTARLDADVAVDVRYVADVVADAVGRALFAPVVAAGSGGLLRGENLGPDGLVFSSRAIAAIMAVEGVTELRSLTFDGTPFVETGRVPAAGHWFDFEAGGVRVNGRLAR